MCILTKNQIRSLSVNAQNIKFDEIIKKPVENRSIIQYNKNVDTIYIMSIALHHNRMMTTEALLEQQSAEVSHTPLRRSHLSHSLCLWEGLAFATEMLLILTAPLSLHLNISNYAGYVNTVEKKTLKFL